MTFLADVITAFISQPIVKMSSAKKSNLDQFIEKKKSQKCEGINSVVKFEKEIIKRLERVERKKEKKEKLETVHNFEEKRMIWQQWCQQKMD